jgi:GNAT superfamily N-acetyltransferase
MSLKSQAQRWENTIKRRSPDIVLVAENPKHGIVGMTSLGPARDRGLGFDGEVYTLYVDPEFYGRGTGRALLYGSFYAMREKHFSSCVIWAHARNNARFFYEAMGGKLIAERVMHVMGENMPEAAFGWRDLAPALKSAAR